ncbi:MAG TPA: hypothetical protein VE570_05280 [Thermoleophilaceae bacterium]|jgi:hypothetical protein|nr:hypothetical protein [Thermoleophilaceae bacterium]
MATLIETYPNQATARKAVNALLASGALPRGVRLLIGERPGDVRNEIAGGFAGPVAPDAPVGTFANICVRRCEGRGTFAGDPERQRRGSFADTCRDVVVSFDEGAEHARVVGDAKLRTQLRQAGCGDARGERVLAELRNGQAAVLAEVPEIAPGHARGGMPRAA